MKERTKRALMITGMWSFAGTILFVVNMPAGVMVENILMVLILFTPVQFATTLGFSWLFLSGTYKKGKVLLVLYRFFDWLADKQMKIHYCEECEEMNGKKTQAFWKAYYAKWWVHEYPKMKYSYYCDSCLVGNFEGVHTGGGPTIMAYKKAKRLKNSVDDDLASEIQGSKT